MQAPMHGGACALCRAASTQRDPHGSTGHGVVAAGGQDRAHQQGARGKNSTDGLTPPDLLGGCLGPRRGQPPFCGAGPARLGPPDPAQPGRLGCFSDFQPFISPDVFPMKSLKISKKSCHLPPAPQSRVSPLQEAGAGSTCSQGIFRGKFRSKQFPACGPAGTMPGILIPRLLWSWTDMQLRAWGSSVVGGTRGAPCATERGVRGSPSPFPCRDTPRSCAVGAAAPRMV